MERTIAAHHGAVLSAEGTAVVSRRLRRAEDDLRTATTARDAEVEHASGLLGELRRQGLVRAEALGELEAAQERVDRLRSAVRSTAVAADVSGTDIPIVALDAYWRAARIVRLLHPNCGLTWWMLAGIGRTESRHGRYGGGRPGPDGTVSVPTVGIPLDGTNNTREIRDSDGGLLDGDAVYDRAVGPMQFIPTTWARWSSDGNGDGIADPQNIYDATLAAGRYLCASGPIDTDERLSHALAHYGGTRAYAAVALGIGRGYAATVVGLPETG